MAEYGQVIKAAFNPNQYHRADEAMARTPWYVKMTHDVVMAHPARELCIAWYFADPDILAEDFPEVDHKKVPPELIALYRKVGKKFNKR